MKEDEFLKINERCAISTINQEKVAILMLNLVSKGQLLYEASHCLWTWSKTLPCDSLMLLVIVFFDF